MDSIDLSLYPRIKLAVEKQPKWSRSFTLKLPATCIQEFRRFAVQYSMKRLFSVLGAPRNLYDWLREHPDWIPLTKIEKYPGSCIDQAYVLAASQEELDSWRSYAIQYGISGLYKHLGCSRHLYEWLGKCPRWKPLTDEERGVVLTAKLNERWSDPVFKSSVRFAWHTEDSHRRAGESQKITKSTPEWRAKVSLESKERWSDPEYHARVSAKISSTLKSHEWKERSGLRDFSCSHLTAQDLLEIQEVYRIEGTPGLQKWFPYLDTSDPSLRDHIPNAIRKQCGVVLIKERRSSRSEEELELESFIKGLGFECIHLPRGSSENPTYYDLDCYVPSLKVGFEYNGVWWHTVKNTKRTTFHRDKSNAWAAVGVKVYFLWSDWGWDLIRSIVKAKLGVFDKTHTYYARKLTFGLVSSYDAALFYEMSHIQGRCGSGSFCFGLYEGNLLVSCLEFKPRKGVLVENARYANLQGCHVPGAFSKLLKYSLPYLKDAGYTSIVSYCDRDMSPDPLDTVYYKNGFTLEREANGRPHLTQELSYYVGRSIGRFEAGCRYNRQFFMKKYLAKEFPDYVSDSWSAKTEWQILEELGIYRVFNSGTWKFTYPIV